MYASVESFEWGDLISLRFGEWTLPSLSAMNPSARPGSRYSENAARNITAEV
jgi:hypothetical protein